MFFSLCNGHNKIKSDSLLFSLHVINQYRKYLKVHNPKTMRVSLCFIMIYVPMYIQNISSNITVSLSFRHKVLTFYLGMWFYDIIIIIIYVHYTMFDLLPMYTCISQYLTMDTSLSCIIHPLTLCNVSETEG